MNCSERFIHEKKTRHLQWFSFFHLMYFQRLFVCGNVFVHCSSSAFLRHPVSWRVMLDLEPGIFILFTFIKHIWWIESRSPTKSWDSQVCTAIMCNSNHRTTVTELPSWICSGFCMKRIFRAMRLMQWSLKFCILEWLACWWIWLRMLLNDWN